MHVRRLIVFVLFAGLLWMGYAPVLRADDLSDGFAKAVAGDYAEALRLWRPLAEQGNVHAQRNLGAMYLRGNGVPQDYTVAASWFRKAA